MSNADGGLTTVALEYLKSCPDIWADRRNSGKVKVRGGWMELCEEGTPDILGYIRRVGRFALPFGIETKAPKGKLNDAQVKWHARANNFGFPVFVCKHMAQVIEVVKALREM